MRFQARASAAASRPLAVASRGELAASGMVWLNQPAATQAHLPFSAVKRVRVRPGIVPARDMRVGQPQARPCLRAGHRLIRDRPVPGR